MPALSLLNLKMAAGNELLYPIVIDEGFVKEWVGIGWIDLGTATEDDYKKYPTVTRDDAAHSIGNAP